MSDFRETVRGILAMLACCLAFILNDSMVKLAGDTLPLGQILFLRGVVASTVIALVAWRLGAFRGWREHLSAPLFWRTFGEVAATLLYLSALMHIPIANASTIAQTVPLVITAAGAILFGEKVGIRRWLAILVGFAGILIIVRPGAEGFNAWSLLTLASVAMVALRDVCTRFIPPGTSTVFISAVASIAVMIVGGGLAATEDWRPVGMHEAGLLLGSGVMLLLGYVFVIIATRTGDVSIIAPFRYAFIPYAILVGWLIWGDVPDTLTVVGIVIVVGTGVYTFHRERKRAQLIAAKSEPAAI